MSEAEVIKLVPNTEAGREGSLKAVEHLRGLIERGEIVTFVAVGIHRDDGLSMVLGGSGKSKTQMAGALHTALFSYSRLFLL